MRTTATSPTPDPAESGGQAGAGDGQGGRPARLIHTEVTTEIPVHLLFRDEAAPAPVPPGSAVVARRPGTGEQSRPRNRSAAAVRAVPEVEAGLEERAARVLPGVAGVAAGGVGTAGCVLASWWAGVLPSLVAGVPLPDIAGAGPGLPQLAACAGAGALGLAGFAGLARGRAGRAWVLGLFGRYRGTVRRTGLLWVNPLVSRRRVDVRLRHWRSEPMQAADPDGLALRVAVLVVWRVRDTARAVLGVDDHETYLRACVEVALARVPVEPPGTGRGPTEAAEGVLTRLVARETAPVGLEVFSVRPARVEWAPEAAVEFRADCRETGP
ncbi:SPFH domain-containing protein [Streptomyces sp. NPDC096152]|uniref:SPFH domain-containing protein n=1 Tax=Streptomyces sp. NPDC096152 TaxID=3366078 RepID=UPI0037FA25AC